MVDQFRNVSDRTNPGDNHFEIVPDDDADLPFIPRAVFCAEDGDLVAIDAGGVPLTYSMTAGQFLPFRVRRVGEATTGTYYGWY